MGDDNKVIYEIRENVVELKAMLKSIVQNTDLKFQMQDTKIAEMTTRIKSLEDTISWLWKTIAGSLITAVIALLINL